ncbi:MAG TPA: hypothetical protein VFC54_00745 [Pseudolabrys sp.]|nr:hypothetical protein [Pseudolabrys sp.]
MSCRMAKLAQCGAATVFIIMSSAAQSHEIVGNRSFPATLAVDDPGVSDELAFPAFSSFRTGDDPSVRQHDISGEFSKRITEDFAVSFGTAWSRIHAPGGPMMTGASGFQNLETAFKYRLFKNPEQEFVMSVGLGIEWGGSGAQDVGAERHNTYTPTIYFGKGFGDLAASLNFARPFAVTGQIGYAIPGSRLAINTDPDTGDVDIETNPGVLVWGGSLQYSMPYLKSSVVDLGLPEFFNRLIPIVELALQTPVTSTVNSGTVTTGTINPGFLWVADSYQIGVEAIIPVNHQSGTGVGAIAQLHFFLDDIFPNSIGRPIFGNGINMGRPAFGR